MRFIWKTGSPTQKICFCKSRKFKVNLVGKQILIELVTQPTCYITKIFHIFDNNLFFKA